MPYRAPCTNPDAVPGRQARPREGLEAPSSQAHAAAQRHASRAAELRRQRATKIDVEALAAARRAEQARLEKIVSQVGWCR